MKNKRRKIIIYALLSFVISIVLCLLIFNFGYKITFNNYSPLADELNRWYAISFVMLITLAIEIYLLLKYLKLRKQIAQQTRNNKKSQFEELDDSNNCIIKLIEKQFNSAAWLKKFNVYRHPWFLVLGEEKSGKTELIDSFHLYKKMEAQDSHNNPINSWRISSEAVFIDTKGEPWSNKNLRELWYHFINWLLVKRPKRPINAIVLSISITKLIKLSPEQRLNHALNIRKEINYLNESFGAKVPIYLTITKIDELQGFSKFVSKLDSNRIDDPLGLSLPLDNTKSWEQAYQEGYETFKNELNSYLYYNKDEESTDSNSEYYVFTRQIIGLQELLFDFVKSLQNEKCNPCNTMIRGIYFTSVKQQNSAFNAIEERANALYEINEELTDDPIAQTVSTAFFSENLCKKILIPEAGLAQDNIHRKIRLRRRAILTYLVTGIVIASLTSGWFYSYRKNVHTNKQVLFAVKQYQQSSDAYQSTKPSYSYLNTLNLLRDSLDHYKTDKSFFNNIKNMGLYRGEAIANHVDETYQALLSKGFAKALVQELVTELEQALSRLDGNDFSENKVVAEYLNIFRVIRLLSEPLSTKSKQEQSTLITYRQSVARPWIANYWNEHYKNLTNSTQVEEQLLNHLDYLLTYSEVAVDKKLRNRIGKLQDTLSNISFSHILYQSLKENARKKSPGSLNFTHELGGEFYETFTTKNYSNESASPLLIPYFFTKKGFSQYYLNQQNKMFKDLHLDYWAIGLSSTIQEPKNASDKQLKQEIIELYLSDYIDTWEETIGSLGMVYLNDMSSVVQFLKAASSKNSPYLNLIKTVRTNTVFTEMYSTEKIDDKAVKPQEREKIAETVSLRLQHNFHTINELEEPHGTEKSYIDTVQERLVDLHKYMVSVQKQSLNQSTGDLAKFKDNQAEKAGDDPIDALRRVSEGLPDPLQTHFQQLANRCSQLVTRLTLQDVDTVWNTEVYSYYLKNIKGKYPFTKSSSEVSLANFKEFFAPKGILDTFYNQYIKNSLEISESDTSTNINNSFKTVKNLFEHASYIRQGLFSENGNLKVSFNIEPISLSNVYLNNVISLAGENIKYSHGKPEKKNITWPKEENKEVSITLTPIDREIANEVYTKNGEWALFHFLDKTSTYKLDSQIRYIRFKGKKGVADYKLIASSPVSPLTKDLFSGFHVPETISLPITKEKINQEYF